MNEFVVHLALSISPLSEERLVVGLLGAGGGQLHFRYAPEKVRWALEAFPAAERGMLLSALKSLQRQVQQQARQQPTLFAAEPPFFLQPEQLQALALQDGSMLRLSPPRPVAGLDARVFAQLYAKAIGPHFAQKEEAASRQRTFRRDFQERLQAEGLGRRADVNYRLPAERLAYLAKDLPVDMICLKDGAIRCLQALDLESSIDTLAKNVNALTSLCLGLEELSLECGLKFPKVYLCLPEEEPSDPERQAFRQQLLHRHQKFEVVQGHGLEQLLAQLRQATQLGRFSDYLATAAV